MSKKIKIFLYIIVGLLVLPLILSYGFLDPYLQKQINKKIENASKGLYSITYSSLHYNLYTLTIHLSDIKITPDGTKLDHIKVKKLVKFKVKSINIKFTKFYSLLFKHHLYFNSIRLDNPFFRVVNLPFKKSTLHLSLQLKQLKSLFKIKHIELNDGAFINYDFIHNKVLSSIQNFSFKARNVSIPSSFKIKDVRFQGLNLKLSNFVAVYDSLHSLEIKKIKISQALKVTEVEGFNYSPRISKYQLCKTYGKSISWNHLLIPQMSFIDLNLDSAKNRKLIARKIYLTKPLYENFSDKKYPKDSVKTIYILSSLQNSDFKFHIDTLNIYKGDIVIETLNKKSRLPNQLFLSEIKGNITDVWISKDSADEKTSIKTKLKGYFQKVVPFTLESYPAHYPNNWVHQGQAHITGFNLKYIKNT